MHLCTNSIIKVATLTLTCHWPETAGGKPHLKERLSLNKSYNRTLTKKGMGGGGAPMKIIKKKIF